MATSNPLFRNVAVAERSSSMTQAGGVDRMTLNGTINKAGILLLFVTMSAVWSWTKVGSLQQSRAKIAMLVVFSVCGLGALALVWLTVRRKRWSPFTAPVYALLEGSMIGVASAGIDIRYPGIAIQAVALTLVMCFCLLVAYRSGLIRVTEAFNRKLTAAISGVSLFYLATLALALMGVRASFVFAGGVSGILISVIVVALAGLSLVSDFDFVAQYAQADLPKYMEWYAALGLVVTLIWLYTEILKLLAKARKTQEGA